MSHKVRTIIHNGDFWFVAGDVAAFLGYARTADAIRARCKGVLETVTPSAGGPQMVKIIPERDVYRLIMRFKLPAAEEFEEHVVGVILPAIRKEGAYVVGEEKASRPPISFRVCNHTDNRVRSAPGR